MFATTSRICFLFAKSSRISGSGLRPIDISARVFRVVYSQAVITHVVVRFHHVQIESCARAVF
jgi:hypothetical protein